MAGVGQLPGRHHADDAAADDQEIAVAHGESPGCRRGSDNAKGAGGGAIAPMACYQWDQRVLVDSAIPLRSTQNDGVASLPRGMTGLLRSARHDRVASLRAA